MRLFGLTLLALSLTAASWKLPVGGTAKPSGPRTYRFTVDYLFSNAQGDISRRERITANYTYGLPDATKLWNDVSVSEAEGAKSSFGPPQKREFMQDFRYKLATPYDAFKPQFFSGFPPDAVKEKNLVWDTLMFETFGHTQFEHLQLNQPYRLLSSQNVDLAGAGVFQNRDVELEWTGWSQRNGKRCALINYYAYFNPLQIRQGMELKGRSHYWGEMWVTMPVKEIEYATLYEDVLGELKLPGNPTPQLVNVFRSGTFERVAQR